MKKQPLLQQAEQQLQEGNLAGALASYQSLLRQQPDQPDLLHRIAIIFVHMGQFENALVNLEMAIKKRPDFAPFYNSQGNLLFRMEKINQAIHAYEKAISLQPNYGIGYNNLGRCFYNQDKFLAAQKAYEQSIQLEPHSSESHYNYGVLLAKLGNSDKALTELKTSLQLKPNNPSAYGQMAQIYLQQANYEKAIEYFQQRLAINPDHIDTLHDLGIAYLESGDWENAIYYFEKTIQATPTHPECYHHLANAYLQAGDQAKALHYYLRQLTIAPKTASYYNAGVLLMQSERHRDAIQYFHATLANDPHYLPAHLNLAAIYLKQGNYEKAIQHYQQAAKLKPEDEEIQHILAALTQNQTPSAAPLTYLQHLFDQYAPYYDKHLTDYLRYKVPQALHQAIVTAFEINLSKWKILDLGCGTGLCGELFKELASQLIGVDISDEMIKIAQKKGIYDELTVADINQALDQYQQIDLVLAADVFTYIGELAPIFSKTQAALKPSGLFAFSIEKTTHCPYLLQETIRYAHCKEYIESLAQQNHFEIIQFDNLILRKQKNENVEGYLVILRAMAIALNVE